MPRLKAGYWHEEAVVGITRSGTAYVVGFGGF